MEETLRCPGTRGQCTHRRHTVDRRYELDSIPVCDAPCASWLASHTGREIFGESATHDADQNPLRPPSRITFHARMKAQKNPDDTIEDKAWKARFERLEAAYKRERASTMKREGS